MWPQIIGGGLSLLGGIMGHSAQRQANRTNIMLQREQRKWEEDMSNTAWQRGTKDMLAAGINPMVAFSQGGASTPNVSAATVQPEDALARGVSSAADKAATAASIDNLVQQNKILKEQAEQEKIETDRLRQFHGYGGGHDYYQDTLYQITSDREIKKIQEDLQRVNLSRQELELRIAQKTEGYNVNSAKAASEIAAKEVDLQEMRLIMMALDIPEKQAMADWFDRVGEASPATKAVMSIGQWLKLIFGDR